MDDMPAAAADAPAAASLRTLELLELPTVLGRAAERAAFSAGACAVRALRPSANRVQVGARLERTTQARLLLDLEPSISLGGARDVRTLAARAARGARLTTSELLEIHSHLRAVRLAVRAVGRHADAAPDLWARLACVREPLDLEERIADAIDEQAEVRDTASDELRRLRRALARQRAHAARLLARLVERAPAGVLQEPVVTERRGRLVVPVRRERQHQLAGVVHDVSASGATVFMEPLAAVEAGNHVRELEVAETREVERILEHLSAAAGAAQPALDAAVQALAALDQALALARYANDLDAAPPQVSADDGFELGAARHPLLERPVPIDAAIDAAQARALLITGPNTGGKTVALKTMGLLHLMAACGMHVPAREGSRVAVFRRVIADIGDAQSIEQSLSTFSSHVRNLRAMVEAAGPGVLALADEIGAGTDPDEGAALGQAVAAALLARGATVVATTHHPALKAFAAAHPHARNASVEFDQQTLRPTYRLRLGVPGLSNALEIAERLDLDPAIVADARTRMSARARNLEQAIAAAHAARDAAERERAASAAARAEAERRRRDLDERLARHERERQALVRDARREAWGLVKTARQALRDARRSARAAAGADARRAARASVMEAERRLDAAPAPSHDGAAPELPEIRVGDEVEAEGFSDRARVTDLDPRAIGVAVGQVRARIDRARVRQVFPAPLPAAARRPVRPRRPPASGGVAEISIRGLRADDAVEAVDLGIDDALRRGAGTLRVIHGKGTGALRAVVAEVLAGHPAIRAHATAPLAEGGDGVTVAALRG